MRQHMERIPQYTAIALAVLLVILSLPIASYLVFDINEICIPAGSLFLLAYPFFFCLCILIGLIFIRPRQRLLILLFLCAALFFTFVFPQSEPGIKLNIALLRSAREETVSLYQADALSQCGPFEYIPPCRLASHTGRVYVTVDGKIEFTIYHGVKNSIKLLYTPNDSGVQGTERFDRYSRAYTHIEKTDTDWYIAYLDVKQ